MHTYHPRVVRDGDRDLLPASLAKTGGHSKFRETLPHVNQRGTCLSGRDFAAVLTTFWTNFQYRHDDGQPVMCKTTPWSPLRVDSREAAPSSGRWEHSFSAMKLVLSLRLRTLFLRFPS